MWWVSGFLCVLLTCRLSEQVQEMIWFVFFIKVHQAFLLASLVAQWLKKKKKIGQWYRRPRFYPWVGKIPWRSKWQPTPVFLPGKSHGQRSLVGYSPWDRKVLDTTERLDNNKPFSPSDSDSWSWALAPWLSIPAESMQRRYLLLTNDVANTKHRPALPSLAL